MGYEDRDTYGMYKNYDASGPGPRLMGADTLIGDDVYNNKDEDLGEIKEIMLDVNNGRIAYAVLSYGGFLGFANKLFAVPWSALTLDTVNKRFVLNVDKESLESAPGFDKDNWPDMADPTWQNTIHSYYGATPYMDVRSSHDTVPVGQDQPHREPRPDPAHRNNERIIPPAPSGNDYVRNESGDDYVHK
jgi:sporulation protein YlmC with PRC-barrel domain